MRVNEFNLSDHYIYSYEQESLRRNEVALIVLTGGEQAVLEYKLKNDRMMSVHIQDKLFSLPVI